MHKDNQKKPILVYRINTAFNLTEEFFLLPLRVAFLQHVQARFGPLGLSVFDLPYDTNKVALDNTTHPFLIRYLAARDNLPFPVV